MCIHGACLALIGESPDLFQKAVPGNGSATVAHQIGQQFEFLIGEDDLCFQIDHRPLIQVDGQIVGRQHVALRFLYRVAAPQRYVASDFAVEGDYSQAAFLAVLGCVIGGITITGLNTDSQQGDKVILDILKRCGGKFKPVEGGYHFDRSLLKATEIDLADCPDLGPILFTLGCFCSGETIIRNAGRLRLKESDRIDAMRDELQKMGARIDVEGDSVHIQGVALHAPNAPLSGHNDHRIVMALAVAAIASGLPALLCGAQAVEKSWPAFWNVLRSLGAKIELSSDKKEDFDIKA